MLALIFLSIPALHLRAAFEVGFDVGFIYYGSVDIFMTTAPDTLMEIYTWYILSCHYLGSFFFLSYPLRHCILTSYSFTSVLQEKEESETNKGTQDMNQTTSQNSLL